MSDTPQEPAQGEVAPGSLVDFRQGKLGARTVLLIVGAIALLVGVLAFAGVFNRSKKASIEVTPAGGTGTRAKGEED